MQKQILRIIDSYNFDQKANKWKNVYIYSSLKSKNISISKTESEIHKLPLTDEILLLFQNGFTNYNSIIITNDYISIAKKNIMSNNVIIKILWNEISKITAINHSLIFEMQNQEVENFDLDIIFESNKEKTVQIVELLQRILKATKGEKETIININNSNIDIQKHKPVIISAIIFLIIGICGLTFYFSKQQKKTITSNYPAKSFSEIEKPNLPKYDTVWSDSEKKDYQKLIRFKTINVFNEPFKITMKGPKWMGFLKGGDKIIIPIEIPEKTQYWIYRMNLTNARIESKDSKLVEDVDFKIKTFKVLGKETKEDKTIESSLTRELLNSINAPSKEKPFTNAYFIDNKKDAQSFQDSKPFEYDINNSIKNTHSRNGLIKFNKSQFVYLGLENEGYDDDIYVTLEVVALIEDVKYFKLKKKNN